MATRILVPPGIGDIYWVLVKLRSFLQLNGLTDPELTIVSYPGPNDSHLRAVDFLKKFDWIKVGDPASVPNDPALQHIWDEAYAGPGRSIFPGVMGYDYFIAYNGCVNSGGYIETADEYLCDWDLSELVWQTVLPERRDYMAIVLPLYGTYLSHEKDFPVAKIAAAARSIADKECLDIVLLGAEWDKPDTNPKMHDFITALGPAGVTSMLGKTSIWEALGYLLCSDLIFGYHNGLSNIGTLYQPSVLLWDDRFPPSTSYAVTSPFVRERSYIALPTKNLTVEQVLAAANKVLL